MIDLRPYQADAIQKMRRNFAYGIRRQMLYSPTGSGKTEIGMAMIRAAVAKGKRIVFLCNRVGLVEQASRRFFKAGIKHGIIQGDNTRNVDCQVIIASIQTVARRGMPDCDLIVIDEAHGVAGSREFRAVIFQRNLVPVVGLSATPFAKGLGKRYHELQQAALFQSVVVAATIPELIADGFLVDCDIYAPSEPDFTGAKTTKNAFGELDYSDKEAARIVDKPQLIGDIVSHWQALADNAPTVCFAANIAHSQHIAESFRAAGIPAEHIDCYTSETDRQTILNRVAMGETKVVSNVGILCEGWDFPACKVMILARPTKSLIRYIQMAGRVLRPHETKERALILDHSGTVKNLGFPTDELPIELDDGTPSKQQKQKEKPLPKPCPSCHFMKPPKSRVCPACGFAARPVSAIEHADGNLTKVEKKATKIDKQQFYSELLAVANTRGYSSGWVSHSYKEKFGVWPVGLEKASCEPSPSVWNFVTAKNIRFSKGAR